MKNEFFPNHHDHHCETDNYFCALINYQTIHRCFRGCRFVNIYVLEYCVEVYFPCFANIAAARNCETECRREEGVGCFAKNSERFWYFPAFTDVMGIPTGARITSLGITATVVGGGENK